MLLQMQNVFKQFYGVNALSSVDFDLKHGEAHALLGLNGAGKSTLINIISGLYEPDYGLMWMDGRPVTLSSPAQAQKRGIFTIHQSPVLVENLSIAENIFLGSEPRVLKLFTDFKTMRRRAAEVLNMLGNPLDPDMPVSALTLAEKYEVSIAKCFVVQPKILILDEPTAGLSGRERSLLFDLIRKLKRRNTGIIYITHRLNEIAHFCDRVTILKDGRNTVTCGIRDMTEDMMIETMCGKQIVRYFPSINLDCGPEVLKVEGLRLDTRLKNVNLSLREGEVLGIAGLAGSGKTELAKTIYGYLKKDGGRIWWRGKEVHFAHPSHAVDHDIGYISDNRIQAGLFMEMGVTSNLTIASLKKQNAWQFIRHDTEQASAVDKVIELDIKIRHLEQEVKYLSGGSQQKVMLGRWMMSDSELFILEEPTHGIDVASKSDIYLAISDLAAQGKSFILMSDDIKELMGLCSRIVVMHQGAVVDEMEADEVSEARILKGVKGELRPMEIPPESRQGYAGMHHAVRFDLFAGYVDEE